jgi:PAS domain-containing protein
LVIWDVDGCIRLANQLVADLVGVPLEDIVGHHLFDFVLPLDATTKVVEGIASGTHESLRSKITVTWPGREDVPVWVWTRAIELDGSRGAVTLIVPGNEVGVTR